MPKCSDMPKRSYWLVVTLHGHVSRHGPASDTGPIRISKWGSYAAADRAGKDYAAKTKQVSQWWVDRA